MKIVHCPKGGRVPEGYCSKSCLNKCKKNHARSEGLLRRLRNALFARSAPWDLIRRKEKMDIAY